MKYLLALTVMILIVGYTCAYFFAPGTPKVTLGVGVIKAQMIQAASTFTPAPSAVSILAFGDLMLDRAVRQKMDKEGDLYPFVRIAPLLQSQDIVVANAEGVFTDNKSISVISTSTLVFTFPTTTLPVLRQLGFTIFSQANNHALNFGWKGLNESQANITAEGMESFGDPENKNPGPLYENIRGISVAFVGYDQFSSQNGTDTSAVEAIQAAHAQGAFVVVYPHWGVEYNASTTLFQRTEAHKFIDAGADLILGSHPHVVEPMEVYKGRAIFYSMGNFVFDQPWDDTREGLAVEVSLTTTDVTYTLVPYEIQLIQPVPMEGALRSIYLLGFSKDARLSDGALRSAIAQGSFVLQR
jgi:poly-gamma-glutamate synthesis protein (capsule biosynthesis protein)